MPVKFYLVVNNIAYYFKLIFLLHVFSVFCEPKGYWTVGMVIPNFWIFLGYFLHYFVWIICVLWFQVYSSHIIMKFCSCHVWCSVTTFLLIHSVWCSIRLLFECFSNFKYACFFFSVHAILNHIFSSHNGILIHPWHIIDARSSILLNFLMLFLNWSVLLYCLLV